MSDATASAAFVLGEPPEIGGAVTQEWCSSRLSDSVADR
jgi:hypothetical protein